MNLRSRVALLGLIGLGLGGCADDSSYFRVSRVGVFKSDCSVIIGKPAVTAPGSAIINLGLLRSSATPLSFVALPTIANALNRPNGIASASGPLTDAESISDPDAIRVTSVDVEFEASNGITIDPIEDVPLTELVPSGAEQPMFLSIPLPKANADLIKKQTKDFSVVATFTLHGKVSGGGAFVTANPFQFKYQFVQSNAVGSCTDPAESFSYVLGCPVLPEGSKADEVGLGGVAVCSP